MHFSLYRKAMLAAVDSNQLEMPYSANLTDAPAAALPVSAVEVVSAVHLIAPFVSRPRFPLPASAVEVASAVLLIALFLSLPRGLEPFYF
jgi:hypothetical protein